MGFAGVGFAGAGRTIAEAVVGDGFEQVVDGGALEGGEGVVLVSGDEDDAAASRELLGELEAAAPRHLDV